MIPIYIGKKYSHKNPLYFRIYKDFVANNEIDTYNICNKTTTIFFSKIVFVMVFYIVSIFNDVLQSGCYESKLGCSNLDWFIDEVIKLEKKNGFLSEKHC